jgi:hypothetical protein
MAGRRESGRNIAFGLLPVVVLILQCSGAAACSGQESGDRKRPEVWMFPPPWLGNGACLKELIAREDEWAQTRARITGMGYFSSLLNVHFSDDEIRTLFRKLRQWNLPFAMDVPVIKKEWPTARESFDLLQLFMKRFTPLGARVDAFAFDEPWYAARHLLGKTGDYAAEEVSSYIALLRKAYPNARVCDIEPYPALKLDEITDFVDKLQKRCTAAGVKGLDTLRLDVDWTAMNNWLGGSWPEVKKLEDFCRARGLRFSLICWASDYDFLKKKGLATGLTWYISVMHTASAYAVVGGTPDEWVVESWLHAPEHAVPETQMDTFTRSVLDLCRMVDRRP